MADDSELFKKPETNPANKKDLDNDKSLGGTKTVGQYLNKLKTSSGLDDLANDVKNDSTDFLNQVKNSFNDRFKSKSIRNNISDVAEFDVEEVSIANRHTNAIASILNNTFSGNLFDAGISTLNLLNFGTKWKLFYTQEIDKDTYPFKYLYYFDKNSIISDNSNLEGAETSRASRKVLQFLETIEDPTILGFSLKIDYDNSPLFKGVLNVTNNIIPKQTETNRVFSEQNATGRVPLSGISSAIQENLIPNDGKGQSNNQNSISKNSNINNSAKKFINDYLPQHRELNYAEMYLKEFSEICSKIFISPENTKQLDYKTTKYKNSYIYEIKGLDKLDNPFVDYKEDNKEHETLEFTLGEDVRMYIFRMIFLYRNLTWSYNMGKKLIPENLLRFNLFIKISDIRNFTRGKVFDEQDALQDSIRNGYSRIIYELKDCEFFFDESIIPETLTVGGFNDVNSKYADIKIRIKYRKVNRIFYSELFDGNLFPFIIGDKLYEPNIDNIFDDLDKNIKFSKPYTTKRKSTDNNIPVVESLNTKLNRLKNRGLFNEDNNDTALTRFTKSIGNKAIKAGATVLDDNIQKVKESINDFGKNVFNNNLSSNISGLLKNQVQTKSNELGKSLHLNTGKQFSNVNEVIDFSSSNQNIVNNPNEDLHPSVNSNVINPNEDLHPSVNSNVISPSEDLHPSVNSNVISPSEDLHPDTNFQYTKPSEDLHPSVNSNVISPSEDLHPDSNLNIVIPNEDLHPSVNSNVISPSEDLHPDSNLNIVIPNEDLHPLTNTNIINPNEDLHPDINISINLPNEDLHSSVNSNVILPSEDLHPSTINNILSPDEKLHPNVNGSIEITPINLNEKGFFQISNPNEYLHNKTNSDIISPDEKLHDNFKKFIKDPPKNNALGDC